jgi:hypothetical protein
MGNGSARPMQCTDGREQWGRRLLALLRLVLAVTAIGFLLRGQIPHAIGTTLGVGLSFLPVLMSGAISAHLIVLCEAAICLSTMGGMTGGQFIGLFHMIPNYDKAMHLLNPLMLAFLALMLCYELAASGRLQFPAVAFTVVVVLAILGVSAVWEVLEYLGDVLFTGIWAQGSPSQDPLLDTMLDMAMNLIGGVLGALLATIYVRLEQPVHWNDRHPSLQ